MSRRGRVSCHAQRVHSAAPELDTILAGGGYLLPLILGGGALRFDQGCSRTGFGRDEQTCGGPESDAQLLLLGQ